jgi:molecular chaperone IbpA
MFTTLQNLNKTFDPFSIGFDRILDEMQEVATLAAKNVKYPPYNIKKVNDKKWVIEMAVAGFAKSDIEIQLEGNKLVVKGAASEDESEAFEGYAFKGIANRDFSHTFKIADKVEIGNAEVVNGMLKIWLESLAETQANIKKIAIK